jgi:uncharacterized protein (TIGR02646 family)
MKYIEKVKNELGQCIEPSNFKKWKEENEDILEPSYQENNAKKAWDCLPSSLPNHGIMEDNIFYYSKNCLANTLLKEQGFLCCYCNREIHDEDIQLVTDNETLNKNDRKWTIEHVNVKSGNARKNTFDYCNLAVSCKGGERIPKSIARYCNNGRGDKPISVTPFMDNCEELIDYGLDGTMNGKTDDIEKTINETLNLNYFKEDRANKIKTYFYQNYSDYKIALELNEELPKLTIKDKEEASITVEELSQKNENGHYKEFCSAIINVLKRDIISIT